MKKWLIKRGLIAPKLTQETGEENARRFVKVVGTLAHDGRTISMYPHPGWYGSKNERYGWAWMLNAKWRERVLELLQAAPVMEARFMPPDSLDGWSFHAYSTVPVPRIAQLDLSATL